MIPALLAGSFIPIVVLFVFTLFAGRWYCSLLCPLGILQDGVARLPGNNRRAGNPSTGVATVVRYVLLAFSLLLFFFGTTALLLLVDPWSVFGRITTSFFLPPVTLGNNLLALFFNYYGSYTFVAQNYSFAGFSVLLTASLSFMLLFFLPRLLGPRSWCLSVCPVGLVLGWVARFSLLGIRLDRQQCTRCGRCAAVCKTGVIDVEEGQVLAGDCVSCFNCLPVCPHDALSYGLKGKTAPKGATDEQE